MHESSPDYGSVKGTLPTFHPEFGRFMLEATPGKPWGIGFKDLLSVEADMKLRRTIAKEHMDSDLYPITLTTFPRLGTRDDFITPYYPPSGPALRSQFVPDEIANPHIRFPTLAANIRWRRGRKVELNVPVFKDTNTPSPSKTPPSTMVFTDGPRMMMFATVLSKTTACIWMLWPLAWEVVVFRSHFSPRTFAREGLCMTSCRLLDRSCLL